MGRLSSNLLETRTLTAGIRTIYSHTIILRLMPPNIIIMCFFFTEMEIGNLEENGTGCEYIFK